MSLGAVRTLGLLVKFSDTPGEVRTGSLFYVQHTREVLRTHGFAHAEIEASLAEGAIAVTELRCAAQPARRCSSARTWVSTSIGSCEVTSRRRSS